MLRKIQKDLLLKGVTLDVTASTNKTSIETRPSILGYSFTWVDFFTLKSSLK